MNRLDIVIPSAGRPDDLIRLLDSLHTQSAAMLAHLDATITVTDDRHSEVLGQRLAQRHPSVRYLRGPSRGPAANRNHGAAAGRAAWILFLDDDCYLPGDLLAPLAAAIADDSQLDFVEGAIRPEGPRPSPNHHAPLNLQGGQMWACNAAIRRQVFEALNGFDERFPFASMEDCELHTRLLSRGSRGRFLETMAVVHPWRSLSERELWKQFVSHAIMADKHPAFRSHWSLANLLRMGAGRIRNFGEGRLSAVTWGKVRTQALFAVLPIGLFAAVRWPWLRTYLARRHANRPAVLSSATHAT